MLMLCCCHQMLFISGQMVPYFHLTWHSHPREEKPTPSSLSPFWHFYLSKWADTFPHHFFRGKRKLTSVPGEMYKEQP